MLRASVAIVVSAAGLLGSSSLPVVAQQFGGALGASYHVRLHFGVSAHSIRIRGDQTTYGPAPGLQAGLAFEYFLGRSTLFAEFKGELLLSDIGGADYEPNRFAPLVIGIYW
jgi:hypothetical protein